MNQGQPGSLCVHGLCDTAPPGDGKDAWRSLGPAAGRHGQPSPGRPPRASSPRRASSASASVVVYAQDGLTLDDEITDGSDNLLFAQNALAWLTPLEAEVRVPEADDDPGVGGHLRQGRAHAAGARVHRTPRLGPEDGQPDTFETDLECAAVLWYLSDWEPPPEFADWMCRLIEDFVWSGGGLLVGGLGLVVRAAGRPGRGGRDRPVRRRRARQAVRFRVHARRVRVRAGNTPITLQPGH